MPGASAPAIPMSRRRVPASSIGLSTSIVISRRLPALDDEAPAAAVRARASFSSGAGCSVGRSRNQARTPSDARFVTTSTSTRTSTRPPGRRTYWHQGYPRCPPEGTGSARARVVRVPRPGGDDAGLESARRADLRHVVGDVPTAGADGDRQPARDRLVLLAVGHQAQDRRASVVDLGVVLGMLVD